MSNWRNDYNKKINTLKAQVELPETDSRFKGIFYKKISYNGKDYDIPFILIPAGTIFYRGIAVGCPETIDETDKESVFLTNHKEVASKYSNKKCIFEYKTIKDLELLDLWNGKTWKYIDDNKNKEAIVKNLSGEDFSIASEEDGETKFPEKIDIKLKNSEINTILNFGNGRLFSFDDALGFTSSRYYDDKRASAPLSDKLSTSIKLNFKSVTPLEDGSFSYRGSNWGMLKGQFKRVSWSVLDDIMIQCLHKLFPDIDGIFATYTPSPHNPTDEDYEVMLGDFIHHEEFILFNPLTPGNEKMKLESKIVGGKRKTLKKRKLLNKTKKKYR